MGDIEVNRDDISGREMDWKSDGLGDVKSGRAVKEPKLNRRDRFGRKVVVLNVLGVDETMARTRVNQGKKIKERMVMIGELSDSILKSTLEKSDTVSE